MANLNLAVLHSLTQENPWILPVVLVGLCLSTIFLYQKHKTSGQPLPPGPKPYPIIGNLLQIPTLHPWKVYNGWRKLYGDVIYVKAFGQGILVVNSLEDVHELLVKRAPNYSDRPYTPVTKLLRVDFSFALMNHTALWREQRAIFHRALNHTQIHRYQPVMEREIRAFLPRLLAEPKDHRNLFRYLLAAIIMRVAYGSDDYEHNKRLSRSAEIVMSGFFDNSDPARLLVNSLHWLRHVPSWVPGAGWQRTLADIATHSDATRNVAFDAVKEQMKTGARIDQSALAVQLIENLPEKDNAEYARHEENARAVSAVAYTAGADTSVSSVIAVVLAMAMYPEVQRRAQEELDTVVGRVRLPTAADIPHLPYVQAILKELMRWHTIGPFAVPHVSKEEDVYKGWRIPANTIILPNSWAIMHDPVQFPDPEEFIPERYLKDGKIDTSVLDGEVAAFGFGRRVCPGRHFSNENLALIIANLLACFNIEPALDADGKSIPLRLEVPHIMISTPLPYECNIVPRSAEHADLIRSCA